MNTETAVNTEIPAPVGFSFQTFKQLKIAFANFANSNEITQEEAGAAAFRKYLTLHPKLPADYRDILFKLKVKNIDKHGKDSGLSTVFFLGPADLHQEVHIYRAANTITLKDLGAIALYTYMQEHP